MLGKLMKYELKATARSFLPLYAALCIFALINRLFMYSGSMNNELSGIPFAISVMLYGFTIFAIFGLSAFVMIQRFYKSLLGDEGYLMFTLPVPPAMLIISKLLISIFWIFISFIVTAFSGLLLAFNGDMLKTIIETLPEFYEILADIFGINSIFYAFEFIAVSLVSTASAILLIYASISLGQLFNRHRIIGSFAAFLALNTISQIITTIFGFATNMLFDSYTSNNMFNLFFANDSAAINATVHSALIISLVINLIFSVVYFFITNYVLSHKLNLE